MTASPLTEYYKILIIAIVRTLLAYFLAIEIKKLRQELREEEAEEAGENHTKPHKKDD